MNSFQKNPFAKSHETKIVGYNKQFDEKQKISDIKENMAKIKFQQPINNEIQKEELKNLSVKDKVDILKNINRY